MKRNQPHLSPSLFIHHLSGYIRSMDEQRLLDHYLAAGHYQKVWKGLQADEELKHLPDLGSMDEAAFRNYLLQNDLLPVFFSAQQLGVNLAQSAYLGSREETTYDPDVKFVTLKGSLFFHDRGGYFQMEIIGVLFQYEWRLLKLRPLQAVAEQHPFIAKCIAGNYREQGLIINEITICDVLHEPEPPPPANFRKPQ